MASLFEQAVNEILSQLQEDGMTSTATTSPSVKSPEELAAAKKAAVDLANLRQIQAKKTANMAKAAQTAAASQNPNI